jgi:hypothetical protein
MSKSMLFEDIVPAAAASPPTIAPKKPTTDVGVETDFTYDKMRDTFRCKRCMKPPKLPPRSRGTSPAVSGASSVTSGQSSQTGRTSESGSQGIGGLEKSRSQCSSRRQRQLMAEEEGSVEATMGKFCATPAQMCANTLVWLISHWNPPRESARMACCPLHAQIELCKKLLKVVSKRPCNPLWSPFARWQCPSCSCTNGHNGEECDICGNLHTEGTGDMSGSPLDAVSIVTDTQASLTVE